MSLHAKLVALAASYIGIKEAGGDNKGPEVEQFQKAVDGRAQGEPWCMAFAQYCISLISESRIYPSEHCMTVWNKSPDDMRSTVPRPGFLVIWNYVGSAAGHVGIIEELLYTGSTLRGLITIEGNTGHGATVDEVVREGDGVHRRVRNIHLVGKMQIVGYIDPFKEVGK